jgi:hypothetical protein
MTGNAVNAKSEALELHELSSEELDAVAGGAGEKFTNAMQTFKQLIQES